MRYDKRRRKPETKLKSIEEYVFPNNEGSLLKHEIVEIHGIEDITSDYAHYIRREPHYPVLRVTMTVRCYGDTSRISESYLEPNWEYVKEKGYYYR